jgi:hypothetical protein
MSPVHLLVQETNTAEVIYFLSGSSKLLTLYEPGPGVAISLLTGTAGADIAR